MKDTVHATPSLNLPIPVKVWDAPTRVFHWLTALSFFAAYLTAESERWRLVHVTFGYTLGALLLFRLFWGVAGTQHARFTSFVRGPGAVLRYVKAMVSGLPEHHIGHNPLGAVAIVLMMGLGVAQLVSGWAVYNELGGEWLAQLHELSANTMLVVVAVHIAGVLGTSYVQRENLARAMVTGMKIGMPEQGIRSTRRVVAILVVIAVVAFWFYQWKTSPP